MRKTLDLLVKDVNVILVRIIPDHIFRKHSDKIIVVFN